MVLGDQNNEIHPSFVGRLDPFLGIDRGQVRMIGRSRRGTVRPFLPQEGIHPVMDKHAVFQMSLATLVHIGLTGRLLTNPTGSILPPRRRFGRSHSLRVVIDTDFVHIDALRTTLQERDLHIACRHVVARQHSPCISRPAVLPTFPINSVTGHRNHDLLYAPLVAFSLIDINTVESPLPFQIQGKPYRSRQSG